MMWNCQEIKPEIVEVKPQQEWSYLEVYNYLIQMAAWPFHTEVPKGEEKSLRESYGTTSLSQTVQKTLG